MEATGAAPPTDEAARPTLTPPVLIVLSPGADPSQELQDAAAELLGPARYHQVAMGQGQAELAVKLLRECAQSGALRASYTRSSTEHTCTSTSTRVSCCALQATGCA